MRVGFSSYFATWLHVWGTVFSKDHAEHYLCRERKTYADGSLFTQRWYCACGYRNGGVTWAEHRDICLALFKNVQVREPKR